MYVKLYEAWGSREELKNDAVISAKHLLPTFEDKWINNIIDESSEKGTKIKIELVSGDFLHAFRKGNLRGDWDFYLNRKKASSYEIKSHLENTLISPLELFKVYASNYDFTAAYIDDRREYAAAINLNKQIVGKFNNLSDQDKKEAMLWLDKKFPKSDVSTVFRLNESVQEVDNYIDFSKTDMQKDFDILNKELFNNELYKIPLKWMKSKSKVGLFTYDRIFGGVNQTIYISTFYKFTRQQYLDVLAHEMIHAYILQKGLRDGGGLNKTHGNTFVRMMRDINAKHPAFNIKPTEDASMYDVTDNKGKELGVVLIEYTKRGEAKCDMMVLDVKLLKDKSALEEFMSKFKKPLNISGYNNINVTIYSASIPALTTFRKLTKFGVKAIPLFNTDNLDTLLAQIKASEKILEIKL